MDETVYWHSKGWDINEQGNKTHTAVVQYVEEKKEKEKEDTGQLNKKNLTNQGIVQKLHCWCICDCKTQQTLSIVWGIRNKNAGDWRVQKMSSAQGKKENEHQIYSVEQILWNSACIMKVKNPPVIYAGHTKI
jgi:hypothetical protein